MKMKRGTPGIAVALILAVAAFASTVQAAPPELMVSEREMQRHLEELGISGEAANNVRAAWGRMAFNLQAGEEARQAVRTWSAQGQLTFLGMNMNVAEDRFRYEMMRWYQSPDQLLEEAELGFVQAYFDALAENAPAQADRAERFRFEHLRSTLTSQIRIERVSGAKVDVITRFEAAVSKHDLNFDDETTAAIEAISSAYERSLVTLLLTRRQELLTLRRAQESDPPLMEGNEVQLRARIDRNMHKYTMDRQLRRLNVNSAQQLLSLVPAGSRAMVEREFDDILYSVPLDGLQFLQFAEIAKRDGHLDQRQSDALDATMRDLKRQMAPMRDELIERFDAIYADASIRAMLREQLTQFTGSYVPTQNLFRERNDEYLAARQKLDTFDEQAVQRLRTLLGPVIQTLEKAAAARQAEEQSQQEAERAEYMDQHYRDTAPGDYHPFLDERELDDILGQVTKITPEDEHAIRAAHDQFTNAFVREVAGHHERMGQIRSSGDYQIEHRKWAGIHTRLEREFEAAVRGILTHDDLEFWDRTMRQLRRERVLVAARSYLQPAQWPFVIDLSQLAHDLNLLQSPSDPLRVAIQQYEHAADAACRRFEDEYMALSVEMAQIHDRLMNGDPTVTRAESDRAAARLEAIPDAILELRFQFAPIIAVPIEDNADRNAFLENIDRKEFEWAFVPTPVEGVIKSLDRDGILDSHQQPAVDAAIHQYEARRRDYHDRMFTECRAFVRERDDDQIGRRMKRIQTIAPERYTIERDTCDAIRAILSAEQLESAALDIRVYLAEATP